MPLCGCVWCRVKIHCSLLCWTGAIDNKRRRCTQAGKTYDTDQKQSEENGKAKDDTKRKTLPSNDYSTELFAKVRRNGSGKKEKPVKEWRDNQRRRERRESPCSAPPGSRVGQTSVGGGCRSKDIDANRHRVRRNIDRGGIENRYPRGQAGRLEGK